MSKKDQKYNMNIDPSVPNWFWHTFEKTVAWFITGPFGTKSKFNYINCEDLEGPYIVLSNHASFIDFAHNVLAMKPEKSCWVASVEEFIGIREWLFTKAKVIPKRKFTNDLHLVKKVINATKRDNYSMTIYPEARFSLAGINEDIGTALGKLVKKSGVPVVVMNQKGNFIRSPQWNKHPYRKIPQVVDFIQIANREQVAQMTAEELQEKIEKAFVYDDYKYQFDNKIKVKSKKRAHNIHKILYKCPICGSEHDMDSKNTKLWCNKCGAIWEMDFYGQMHCLNNIETFTHVPDWYRYEREETNKEVENGTYYVKERVRVEHLVSAKRGFKVVGEVDMIHDNDGYHFEGTLNDGTPFTFTKTPQTTRSMHIEYDYKGRGDALDIVYNDETYFVFPLTNASSLTKYNFSTEAIYFKNANK